jgi:hypothetical protein
VSIDLMVGLAHTMSLDSIESCVSRALADVLSLGGLPAVHAQFDAKKEVDSEATQNLSMDSPSVLCSLQGEPDQIQIVPFCVPVRSRHGIDEDSAFVSVSSFRPRSALGHALTAAVAIGVAREQGLPIEDQSLFFTSSEFLSSEEFLKRIRVSPASENYYRAASILYESLPKSKDLPNA